MSLTGLAFSHHFWNPIMGKRQRTFDQALIENPDLDPIRDEQHFLPNTALEFLLVFEPIPEYGHVRITARTRKGKLLWGFVASGEMLKRHPVEVAIYEELIQHAQTHFPRSSEQQQASSVAQALAKVASIRKALDAIEQSLTPKKVTDKTEKRASCITHDLDDALRLLNDWTSSEAE